MEGVKNQKVGLQKTMEILTFAARSDNPYTDLENSFPEKYDSPIHFHLYFYRLATIPLILQAFSCPKNIAKSMEGLRVCKISNENEWDCRNFLKMSFQNQWKGRHFW